MLYPIENREDLKNLSRLFSLEVQVKAVRLQDKLGKQNYYEEMKNVVESMTDIVKGVSKDITKTITIFLLRTTKHLQI